MLKVKVKVYSYSILRNAIPNLLQMTEELEKKNPNVIVEVEVENAIYRLEKELARINNNSNVDNCITKYSDDENIATRAQMVSHLYNS